MHKQSEQRRGVIEMTIAMAICGTIGVTIMLSGQALSDLIFFRCLFGSLIIGGLCWYKGVFQSTQFTPLFWVASIIGGIALLTNWYFLFSAYHNTSVGIATTIYNTQPFIFVLLSALFFKEKVTPTILVWLSISFVGLCLVASTKMQAMDSYDSYLIGIAYALIAAALYAVASIAAKFLRGYSPMLIAFFQLGLGVVVFLPFTNFSQLSEQISAIGIAAIVALGVIHTGLMYILLYGAIQKLPAYQVASLSFLYPALALVIDFVFLDVRLEWLQIAGILLILAGAAGNNLQDKMKQIIAKN